MKNKFKVMLICVLSLCLFSCNQDLGWGNYVFNKVHINTLSYNKCVNIKTWRNNSGNGIEVKTVDYGSLFLSEGTYILVEDKCPICDSK